MAPAAGLLRGQLLLEFSHLRLHRSELGKQFGLGWFTHGGDSSNSPEADHFMQRHRSQ